MKVSEIALPGLPARPGAGPRLSRAQVPDSSGLTLLLYSDGLVESCDEAASPLASSTPRRCRKMTLRVLQPFQNLQPTIVAQSLNGCRDCHFIN